MIEAGTARRMPSGMFKMRFVAIALAVAGALVGLLLVLGGGSSKSSSAAHKGRTANGEINLTQLRAAQMRPLSSRVSEASVRLHPQLVKVAGVGDTGDFTSATDQSPSSGGSAKAPSETQIRNQLISFRRYLRSTPGVPVAAAAAVLPDGTAVAPLTAPSVVAAVIQGGNEIARTPYKWGGGHGAWADNGYDCSGSVSFALAGAGLLGQPLTSGQLMQYGDPGPGRWITIYASGTHTFMFVAGLRFDTSGRSGPRGTRWQPALRPTSGFVARHPPGL
jgi:cell wall-associated NlpC family hydrolase